MQSLQRKVLRTICPDQKALSRGLPTFAISMSLILCKTMNLLTIAPDAFFMRTELEGIFNDSTLLADLDSALPEGSVRELNPPDAVG